MNNRPYCVEMVYPEREDLYSRARRARKYALIGFLALMAFGYLCNEYRWFQPNSRCEIHPAQTNIATRAVQEEPKAQLNLREKLR
jgi:hypothetical protein